jgi:hypothetical protein
LAIFPEQPELLEKLAFPAWTHRYTNMHLFGNFPGAAFSFCLTFKENSSILKIDGKNN